MRLWFLAGQERCKGSQEMPRILNLHSSCKNVNTEVPEQLSGRMFASLICTWAPGLNALASKTKYNKNLRTLMEKRGADIRLGFFYLLLNPTTTSKNPYGGSWVVQSSESRIFPTFPLSTTPPHLYHTLNFLVILFSSPPLSNLQGVGTIFWLIGNYSTLDW